MPQPFDAVLLIAFGGPLGPGDVRPFLDNVLRGRRVSPERLEEVAHHYERFGGVSPLTDLTYRQARALASALAHGQLALPVYVGMRNWHPLLRETLTAMARDGVRRAIGVVAAAHRSYSSCQQYRENVRDARKAFGAAGGRSLDVVYVRDWHEHPLFVEAWARHIDRALESLPSASRAAARLVFTAHSIPMTMATGYPYREQLLASCRAIADRLRHHDWTLVYQSRSGRPDDPWLEPDVLTHLREARRAGLKAAVLCPVGFIADHVEVLYDLDHEALALCREMGLPAARAETPNDDPVFIEMLADVVRSTWRRYEHGTPLQVGF